MEEKNQIIVGRESGYYSTGEDHLYIVNLILSEGHKGNATLNRNGLHWAMFDQRPFFRVNYFGFFSFLQQ